VVGRRLLVLGNDGVVLTGDANAPLTIFPLRPDGAAGRPIAPRVAGAAAVVPAVTVYAGSQEGDLYALDSQTGAYAWSIHTGGPVSSPVVY
jgi:outer membrane protein assembly factor BamB